MPASTTPRAASRRGSASRASSSSTATAPSAGVPHVRCGKLIVATDEAQLATLRDDPRQCRGHRHAGSRALDGRAGAWRWSRRCTAPAALWSPTTGDHRQPRADAGLPGRRRGPGRHDRVREPAGAGRGRRATGIVLRGRRRGADAAAGPRSSSTAPACTRRASRGGSTGSTRPASAARPTTARATTTRWPAARRSRG